MRHGAAPLSLVSVLFLTPILLLLLLLLLLTSAPVVSAGGDTAWAMLAVERNITAATASVRQALDAARNPASPTSVPHTYNDKFAMAELATRAALSVQLATLAEGFALSPEARGALNAARGGRTVTLRLTSSASCGLVQSRVVEVESPTRTVVKSENSGGFWGVHLSSEHTVTQVEKVTEHVWDYRVTHVVEVRM
jgi:hypothetical protein